MKKSTIILASFMMLFSLKVSAQNERVLLFECFTNTGCGPCAQQNPALDALINANADRIAAIKYHMSWPSANDPMYLHNTTDNDARRGVYNVNSVPHTVVDGIRFGNIPSGLTQNMVNNWLNIESPYEMRLSYEVDEAANLITVHVMGQASTAIEGSLRLYVGVIEKAIHFNSAPGPNGEKDFYSVMKKLLPSASGTNLGSVEAGDYFAYTFTWELANIYDMSQLDAIAWIQNFNTKEVYQACKSSENIEPFYENEASVSDISEVKKVNCSGEAKPKVVLTNNGSNTLTSAELEVLVNDELLKTLNWSGSLSTFQSETVDLGKINFPVETQNTLEVRIKSINGGSDQASINDITSLVFKGSPETVGKVLKLTIRTDANPQETSWKVTNLLTGEAVLSGGPYEQPNTMYTETLDITGDGCYDFTIYDAGGNGLEGGVYGLKAGGTTLFSGNTFGESESNEFSYEVTADMEESLNQSTKIYPNPTEGNLNIYSQERQNVTIYNMAGQRVFEGSCDGLLQIDMKRFGAGIYAVSVGSEIIKTVVK
ncbi:MAG: T9SS type A sorting domain-containing protein [Bacteroidales bacterium]|nr:T9SS type A sorting domain-containing protein [Bacteroidales bacterium]